MKRKLTILGVAWASLAACAEPQARGARINVKGSDTLVQVAAGWAEIYRGVTGDVEVSASGGGSGTGIAGLIDGTVDVATSSREIKDEERKRIEDARGAQVRETVVGFDALAIYVHRDNPIPSLSISQLGEVWAEEGAIQDWSQLDPQMSGKIVLIGRQNSAGTYDYFRQVICGKDRNGVSREFRGGVSELNGSSEVVEKVSKAKQAMGYTGMGYRNQKVRWLGIARGDEEPVMPSLESALDGSYPLARKLYLYTVREETPEVRAFIEWALMDQGQAIVAQEGYVPAP